MASSKHLPLTDPEIRRRFEGAFRKTERIPEGFDTPCWLWQRKPDKDGYGNFRWNGVLYKAHRFSYMLYVAETENIEPGMDVDHKCTVRKCVQPDHLELVTHHENVRRAWAKNHDANDDDIGDLPDPNDPIEPEVVLESIDKMLAGHDWTEPAGISSESGAPWRDVTDLENGFDPADKWHRAALLLFAVECGVKPRIAALHIFNATPYMLDWWSRRNAEWKKDIDAARKKSITKRWCDYQDTWFDRAERKMKTASAQDLARFGAILVKRDAVDASRGKGGKGQGVLSSGINIFVLPPANPGQLLDDIIEAEYARTVEHPALSAPDDDDEDD